MLLLTEVARDGLVVDLASPGPIGSVQFGGIALAGAARSPATSEPTRERAGQRESTAGHVGDLLRQACGFGLGLSFYAHDATFSRSIHPGVIIVQYATVR